MLAKSFFVEKEEKKSLCKGDTQHRIFWEYPQCLKQNSSSCSEALLPVFDNGTVNDCVSWWLSSAVRTASRNWIPTNALILKNKFQFFDVINLNTVNTINPMASAYGLLCVWSAVYGLFRQKLRIGRFRAGSASRFSVSLGIQTGIALNSSNFYSSKLNANRGAHRR